MADVKIGIRPFVKVVIDGTDKQLIVNKFMWKSFSNNGYEVICRLVDPYFNLLKDVIITDNNFLEKGRNSPFIIKFKFGWNGTPDETSEKIAIVTDFRTIGTSNNAMVEFTAIDPPSWYLNSGKSDGSVYKGNITKVIEDVIKKYATPITAKIAKTNDNVNNKWWMMRMDPKSFIMSLLEWSSPLNNSKTTYSVYSDNYDFVVSEVGDVKEPGTIANYVVKSVDSEVSDVLSLETAGSNFLSRIQSKITTSGISSISGQFYDKIINKEDSVIDDDNTNGKINSISSKDNNLGFKKSSQEFSTHIPSIPEFSGGELGMNYGDYISGRARNTYLSMLNALMRVKITVLGDYRIDKSSYFNSKTVNLVWYDSEGEPYFLSGNWMIYGFCHKFDQNRYQWYTDVYLYRLDFDSKAKNITR